MNEEMIIATGLTKVRQGILDGSWDLVCEGYNSISGEELSSPEKKATGTTLVNIRHLIGQETVTSIVPADLRMEDKILPPQMPIERTDFESMQIPEIRRWIFEVFGVDVLEDSFEDKNALIEMAHQFSDSSFRDANVKKEGDMTIISSDFNQKEAKENAKVKPKRTKRPKVASPVSNNSSKNSFDIPAPPWRD